MHTAAHIQFTRTSQRIGPVPRLMLTGGSLTTFLAVAHTAADSVTGMFAALLPIIQDRFGLTETVLAALVAVFSLSASLTQPLFGALADRLGRRRLTALGIIVSAGLLGLVGVVPTVWLLIGLLVVGGLGSAAFHPAGASLARMTSERRAGLAVSLFGAGGTLGLALGPVLILAVVSAFGLRATPWLMLPGLLLGVLTLLVVPDERESPQPVQASILHRRLITGPVGLLTLVATLSSIVVVTFSSAMPLWLVRDHAVPRDDALIGWTLAVFSFSAAIGSVLAAAFGSRVNPRVLVPSSMLLALLPLMAMVQVRPGTLVYFLLVTLAGGLLHAGFPLLVVRAQDLAAGAIATASGMVLGLATGVAGLLYIAVGRLQEMIGLMPAMQATYLLLLLGAVLAFLLLSRSEQPTRQRDV